MASAVQLTILLEKRVDNEALKGVKVMIIDDSNTIRRSAEIFLNQPVAKSSWRRTVSMRCPRLPITSRMWCSSTS